MDQVVFIGNYLPRRCGIATFTTDLRDAVASSAPSMHCSAVAMNDIPEGYRYPEHVRFELNDWQLPDYQLAADFLNMNRVDLVCLQHEFGIFGGERGSYVLELCRRLRMPLVTTLHTVLERPDSVQRAVLEQLGKLSQRLVVMSERAFRILSQNYDIPAGKITLIHHGIPDVPFVDPNYYKDQFGVEGRNVILTFGLISPGKGIEVAIDALPRIVERFPETTYIVLGATHPHVLKNDGEAYRLSLQLRAREKGVDGNLIFHNRFVSLTELCEFLGVADLYVTPYLNREQITSGTLAYALGSGKAVISTPYWYAEEILDEGRGKLVPFQDSEKLGEEVIHLLEHATERHAMRKKAYLFGRKMIWREVANSYLQLFEEIRAERAKRPRGVARTQMVQADPLELPEVKLNHLNLLTDDVGILQHSKFTVPNRNYGYCTDDNARALIAVLMAQAQMADEGRLHPLSCRYLSFLYHAYNEDTQRFRNFMGYDRRWLEDVGSEDSHARAIWALGAAVGFSSTKEPAAMALDLFDRALPVMTAFTSPRAWAFGLIGIHSYLRRFSGDSSVRRVREVLAGKLFDLYQSNASDDWPWLEDIVAYDNGKICQALIMSGTWLQRGEMIEAGLISLAWLIRIQKDPRGYFVPVGNQNLFSRKGRKARFDQQPIEAEAMIEACLEAYLVTAEQKWLMEARCCFDWFLGRNDKNVPLYDDSTGGCCDGLSADGPNQNQGAESTLACLLSLLHMRAIRDAEALAFRKASSEDSISLVKPS